MKLQHLVHLALLTFPMFGYAQIDDKHWFPTTHIVFPLGSSKLNASVTQFLVVVKERMNANPNFKLVVEGRRSKDKTERLQNRARVNAALNFLLIWAILTVTDF